MNRVSLVVNGLYQRDWLLLLPILLCSLIIRAYVLHLPGPNPDELLYAFPAEMLRIGDPVWAATFHIARHPMPAGLDGYQGGFPIYIHWFISELTDYPLRFRAINILYALMMIGFTYFFTLGFISKSAALFSALMLATMPSLVFFSRIGEIAIFLRIMLATAVLYCFYRWSTQRSWHAFYAGSLALGLGISTRLEIIWWVVAAFTYLAVLDRTRLRRDMYAFWAHKVRALIGVACFLAGSSLFITYNVITKGGTITQIAQNFGHTQAGHNNMELFSNLIKRINHLFELLDGSNIWGMSTTYRNGLFSLAFAIAFMVLLAIAIAARLRRQPEHKIEFLISLLVLMLIESTFSVSTINVMHILILMPVPVLILVKFLDLIPWRTASVLTAAALLAGNLWVDARYYDTLRQVGGRGIYSTRAYSFAKELEQMGVAKVFACDWGLARLVYYFSQGRIKVEEIFGYSRDIPPTFYYGLAAALQQPNTFFLFYAPTYSTFERQQAFLDYLRKHGLTYQERVFQDNYGPIYLLYKVPLKEEPGIKVQGRKGLRGLSQNSAESERGLAKFAFAPAAKAGFRDTVAFLA